VPRSVDDPQVAIRHRAVEHPLRAVEDVALVERVQLVPDPDREDRERGDGAHEPARTPCRTTHSDVPFPKHTHACGEDLRQLSLDVVGPQARPDIGQGVRSDGRSAT